MRLVEVTSNAQKLSRDRHTHAEWGKRLSVDEYLVREQRLRSHPFARAGMRTWFWVDERWNPAGTSNEGVLASCETFQMNSAVDGAAGTSHAVASVFTEPALRGHGYAGAMMNALTDAVRAVDPGAQALTLFSDVGEALYARAGYQPCPAVDLVLPALAGDPRDEVDAMIGDEQVGSTLSSLHPPADRFRIWPTATQLDWHWERMRIYAEVLGRPLPRAVGARADGGAVFWAGSVRDDLLLVLLASGPTRGVSRCLRAAQRLAAQLGLYKVVAWADPDLVSLADELGGTLEPRAGSLPMVLPLVSGFGRADFRHVPRALWV